MAMIFTMKPQKDTGVNENTIRKANRYTLKIQMVILLTAASPKSSNTTDVNTN